MAGLKNAKIIISRCAKTKASFGIRIEQIGIDWVRTWAFPINEAKAKNEGYDTNKVTGSMQRTVDFPGCPYCGSKGFVHCSCGKIGCWNAKDGTGGEYGQYTCPWCNCKSDIYVSEKFDISGSGY